MTDVRREARDTGCMDNLLLSQLHRRVVILERALVLLSARCGDQELSDTLVALALDADDPDAVGVLYGMARAARKHSA